MILVGGGTGGHLYPAIAVKESLKRLHPTAMFLFVGTRSGLEARVLPSRGEKLKFLWISGFSRNHPIKNILLPLKLFVSLCQSLFLLASFRPQVVIGTGGFVTGPLIFMAQLLNIPTVLQEQNSIPGIATRKLASRASAICIGNPDARQRIQSGRIFDTGNPIAPSFLDKMKSDNSNAIQLDRNRKTLLVLGGSLGAQSLNKAVAECFDSLLGNFNLIWQTGRTGIPDSISSLTIQKYSAAQQLIVKDYFDNMQAVYAQVDVAICRAGAMTLAELAVCGVPSILVPFPFAAEDHQTANAMTFVNAGAAQWIQDRDLNGERLLNAIHKILRDPSELNQMSLSAKSLARPDAADHIARIVSEFLPK